MQINPYLVFDGTCEEAFKFYEKTLGGKLEAMMRHNETPAAEHVPPDMQNTIIHARLAVGDKVLMGSDAPHEMYAKPSGMNVSIGITDPAEAERIFNAFAEGGSVLMPLEKTFWAERFGMVTDRFGTPWMVNCASQDQ